MKKISHNFYNKKTLWVAKNLLGKYLIRKIGKRKIIGKIVETEAYVGPKDLASHASRGRTPRTEVMFGPPGHAYVYLIYGLNYCFNVVTEKKDYPAAVLIRAVEPVEGVDLMFKNRGISKTDAALRLLLLTNASTPKTGIVPTPKTGLAPVRARQKFAEIKNAALRLLLLTNGPGKLCQAFKIDKKLNNIDLTGNVLWIEDRGIKIKPRNIVATKRIGIPYAKEYKNKPWRFYIQDNSFVSKP